MGEDIQRWMGRIEAKLDQALTEISSGEKKHDALEARIRELEQWRWKAVGIATAAGSLLGGGLGAALKHLG